MSKNSAKSLSEVRGAREEHQWSGGNRLGLYLSTDPQIRYGSMMLKISFISWLQGLWEITEI